MHRPPSVWTFAKTANTIYGDDGTSPDGPLYVAPEWRLHYAQPVSNIVQLCTLAPVRALEALP